MPNKKPIKRESFSNQIIRCNGKVWIVNIEIVKNLGRWKVVCKKIRGCVNSPDDLEEAIQGWLLDKGYGA